MIEESSGKSDKMSKSLGNVFNLQDIIDQGFRPSSLRFLYLGVHYRKQLRFSWAAMAQAEEAVRRLTDFLVRLDTVPARPENPTIETRLAETRQAFGAHIDADLNTAAAIGECSIWSALLNAAIDAGEVGAADAAKIRETFDGFDRILGVLSLRRAEEEQTQLPVDEIDRMVAARKDARLARNFAEADRIRKDLESRGILLEDTGRRHDGRASDGEAVSRDATGDARPDIKTALPGPKAKAIIDRDRKYVSPSYTRDYPFVIARGEGAVVEDVDGNRFLDCAAGIAVNSTGVCHPEVVKAIADQARIHSHVGDGLLLRAAGAACGGARRHRADRRRRAHVLRKLRDGGHRSGDQARAVPHQAPRHHRVPRRVSRTIDGLALADREQGDPAAWFWSLHAGRVSRAVSG